MINRTFVLLLGIAMAGCASVPMGDVTKDAELKAFKISAEKAGIYIYRNESIGAAVKMDVGMDGQNIGQTAAKTYLYKEVSPGLHTITSSAENTDTLHVDVKKGTLAYIWQDVKMGMLYAGSRLHLVSPEEGQKGVLESTLAATK
jgi:hypothetical protein